MIALLLGLQQGFTKYCCFNCEWDSRARSLCFAINAFKAWSDEKFCKGHEHRRSCLYLREKFPRLSEAKLKESIFIGPQIRDLINVEYFDKLLYGEEKAAWDSFKFVVKEFLGNRRAENYEELVNNL